MRRTVMVLDLIDSPEIVEAYDLAHRPGSVWAEVTSDLRERGYHAMTIWRVGNRLTMIVDHDDAVLTPVHDAQFAARLATWDTAMRAHQQSIAGPCHPPNWVEMKCVYDLAEH